MQGKTTEKKREREGKSNMQGKKTEKKRTQLTRMNSTAAQLCSCSHSEQIVQVQAGIST